MRLTCLNSITRPDSEPPSINTIRNHTVDEKRRIREQKLHNDNTAENRKGSASWRARCSLAAVSAFMIVL